MAFFERVYQASSTIPASRDEVWAVLIDLDSYEAWNPFTSQVQTQLEVGKPVSMRVHMGAKASWQTETLLECSAPHTLRWGIDTWPRWLLWAERVQTLEEHEGSVVYDTQDTIGGVLLPLVHLVYGAAIQRGFEGVALGLKDEVERRCVSA